LTTPKLQAIRFTDLSGIVANAEVGSYPAISPLPFLRKPKKGGIFSVALSVPGTLCIGTRVLSGTMPCGARTFLHTGIFG